MSLLSFYVLDRKDAAELPSLVIQLGGCVGICVQTLCVTQWAVLLLSILLFNPPFVGKYSAIHLSIISIPIGHHSRQQTQTGLMRIFL